MSGANARLKYNSITEPDSYTFGLEQRPSDDFVISRNKNGEVVSYYSYDRWDFSAYCRPTQRNKSIIFPVSIDAEGKKSITELKWLTFVLLYHKKEKKRSAVGTLIGKFRLLLVAHVFASEYELSLFQLFSQWKLLKALYGTLPPTQQKKLIAIVRSLGTIATSELGFKPAQLSDAELLNTTSSGDKQVFVKQTAIIPERIYAECARDLTSKLVEFNTNFPKIEAFIKACLNDGAYAKSYWSQRSKGLNCTCYVATFPEASLAHGLTKYFDKHSIKSIASLCHHFMLTQFRSKTLMHIYSGMRDEEVLSAKYDCLQMVTVKKTKVLRLIGVTTKLEKGQERLTHWITCEEVTPAIDAAKSICKVVAEANKLSPEKMYLFLTPSHLPFSKRHYGLAKLTETNFVISNLKHHFYGAETFCSDEYLITADDRKFLKHIDFTREWENEPAFDIGKSWPFATHQFRRSLAVYGLTSRLISLSSLKRQLKHISLAMTLYYVNGNLRDLGSFSLQQNFKDEVLALKDTVDALDYINLALGSERLMGTHGTHIEQRVKPLGEEAILVLRDETIKRANRGEFRFSNTHLGGCVSATKCGKPLINPLTSCLHCAKSILDPKSVEQAILTTENQLLKLPDGPERTTLSGELVYLQNYIAKRS